VCWHFQAHQAVNYAKRGGNVPETPDAGRNIFALECALLVQIAMTVVVRAGSRTKLFLVFTRLRPHVRLPPSKRPAALARMRILGRDYNNDSTASIFGRR